MIESFLANFHFIRPGWLLMVPVAGGLWWLWRRSIEPLRGWSDQVDPDLLQAMTGDDRERQNHGPYWILSGWILAIVAIAGPTWRQEPNPFAGDAAPLMVLLKADRSMDQQESSPTALERAQLKIADLVEIRKGQPIGLIAYAGSAHLVLPPTRDTTIVAEMAAEISSEIMPQSGDRLDLALRKAAEILSGEEAGGTILVIADLVEGEPQSIAQAYQEAGSFPLQFLAVREDQSLRETARLLKASVESLTSDDQDVVAIAKAAERKAVVGMAGESQRWQEAGYWLTPLLAVLVAALFRREQNKSAETSK